MIRGSRLIPQVVLGLLCCFGMLLVRFNQEGQKETQKTKQQREKKTTRCSNIKRLNVSFNRRSKCKIYKIQFTVHDIIYTVIVERMKKKKIITSKIAITVIFNRAINSTYKMYRYRIYYYSVL